MAARSEEGIDPKGVITSGGEQSGGAALLIAGVLCGGGLFLGSGLRSRLGLVLELNVLARLARSAPAGGRRWGSGFDGQFSDRFDRFSRIGMGIVGLGRELWIFGSSGRSSGQLSGE